MVSHQIKYTLKTDNGSYLVEATDLPLPISHQMDFYFHQIVRQINQKHLYIPLMKI
jgi:hypothetical protein